LSAIFRTTEVHRLWKGDQSRVPTHGTGRLLVRRLHDVTHLSSRDPIVPTQLEGLEPAEQHSRRSADPGVAMGVATALELGMSARASLKPACHSAEAAAPVARRTRRKVDRYDSPIQMRSCVRRKLSRYPRTMRVTRRP
jgi:hypothetical protein